MQYMLTEPARERALHALSQASAVSFDALDRIFPTRPWRHVVDSALWFEPEIDRHRDERERNDLHNCLRTLFGRIHAGTLMEYLPPVPWTVLGRFGVEPPMRADAA